MWTKDGKIYTGGGIIAADGRWHSTPTRKMFIEAGWTWKEPPAPTPAPKRYSKLKIIRALGDGWEAKKLQLEQAELYDQFMAAQFMAENDPAFAAFCQTLTPEELAALEQCQYDD